MSYNKNIDNFPLVSILVPIYGEDDCLPQCIKSLIEQDYPNLEVILVDDGSPDNCPKICDEWAKNDSRIKVVHKNNGGLVSARKEAIIKSTGEYIACVDGDDWIDNDYITTMMQALLKNNCDVVTCGYKKEINGCSIQSHNGLDFGIYDRTSLETNVFPTMIYDDRTSIGSVCTYLWNKIFKREILISNQLNVDNSIVIGEDSLCVYPSLLKCNNLAVIAYNGYHYRQRNGSLLRNTTISTKALEKLKLFYFEFCKFIGSIDDKWNLKRQLDYYYTSQLLMMSDVLFLKYKNINWSFPFFNLPKDQNVIIYSAGAFGLHLFNMYNNNKYCNIVAWTDPDYKSYKLILHNPIISLEEALKKKYDKILIASVNADFIKNSKDEILKYGVEEQNILDISSNIPLIIKELNIVGAFNED